MLELPRIDTLLVSYEICGNGRDIAIVGRKGENGIEIVNVFEGDNARAIYDMLTETTEGEDGA